MPRCKSFRQAHSSVASERGVPSEGQIRSHGMGGPLGYLKARPFRGDRCRGELDDDGGLAVELLGDPLGDGLASVLVDVVG